MCFSWASGLVSVGLVMEAEYTRWGGRGSRGVSGFVRGCVQLCPLRARGRQRVLPR